MKKCLLLLCLLLGPCAVAWAAGSDTLVRVHLRSGSQAGFLFSSRPEITYSGPGLTITSTGESLTWTYDEVEKLTFESVKDGETPEGISQITDEGAAAPLPVFSLHGSALSVSGLAKGSTVRVYDAGGRLCLSAVADASGAVSAPLPAASGVYLVSTPVTTFKLIKK